MLGPLLKEKLPLVALAVASAVVTILAQRGSAVVGLDDVTLPARVGNALVSFVDLPREDLLAIAAWLPSTHTRRSEATATPGRRWRGRRRCWSRSPRPRYLGRRRHPYLPWGWLWFLGTLLPVIGIVQVGLQSHADRYTYVPSIGILVAATWLAGSLVGAARWRRAIAAVAAAASILLLGVAARAQVSTWRTSEALWRHALAVTSGNWQAWTGLGDALFEGGRVEESAEAHRRSLADTAPEPGGLERARRERRPAGKGRRGHRRTSGRRSVSIPGYADAWYNLGTAHGLRGEHALAEACLARAVAIRPEDARLWANLAVARSALGDRAGVADAMIAPRANRSRPGGQDAPAVTRTAGASTSVAPG